VSFSVILSKTFSASHISKVVNSVILSICAKSFSSILLFLLYFSLVKLYALSPTFSNPFLVAILLLASLSSDISKSILFISV